MITNRMIAKEHSQIYIYIYVCVCPFFFFHGGISHIFTSWKLISYSYFKHNIGLQCAVVFVAWAVQKCKLCLIEGKCCQYNQQKV